MELERKLEVARKQKELEPVPTFSSAFEQNTRGSQIERVLVRTKPAGISLRPRGGIARFSRHSYGGIVPACCGTGALGASREGRGAHGAVLEGLIAGVHGSLEIKERTGVGSYSRTSHRCI